MIIVQLRIAFQCPWPDWDHHLFDGSTGEALQLWQVASAVHWTSTQQAMGWPDGGRIRLMDNMRGMPRFK